jgi:coatomer subunit beta'
MYSIREGSNTLQIFKNFKESKSFKPDFGAEGLLRHLQYSSIHYHLLLFHSFSGIFGGYLLGVRSVSGLAFYDWESTDLVRRIEITPKHVSSL